MVQSCVFCALNNSCAAGGALKGSRHQGYLIQSKLLSSAYSINPANVTVRGSLVVKLVTLKVSLMCLSYYLASPFTIGEYRYTVELNMQGVVKLISCQNMSTVSSQLDLISVHVFQIQVKKHIWKQFNGPIKQKEINKICDMHSEKDFTIAKSVEVLSHISFFQTKPASLIECINIIGKNCGATAEVQV